MLGPPRKIFWAHHPPIPNNSYPLYNVQNYSLGGSAKSFALFVPHFQPHEMDLKKQEGEKSEYGKDLGLLIPQQGRGSTTAFLHPIKVSK